jgi:hypothetical protein|nr:MAG TPA: hypothetical protein [Caudoviricetes sp.]DAI99539.1 MAG TPA: hypothetical protein [Caudoviricetes sp.]
MGKEINRIGERNYNNFGSEMVIVNYNGCMDIDVYFPEFDWIFKHAKYNNFKKGEIKCPYERRFYNVGYLGEGKYKVSENGKNTRVYDTWKAMLQRCYSEKEHERHPTYIGCEVYEGWHNFQNFAKWYKDNYYEVGNEKMCLDKDILFKGNKIYSPDTCIFVPETINKLFIKNDKNRGESVIGATLCKNGKYQAQCNIINPETGKSKQEYLGLYDSQEKAFQVYKYHKERNIKQIADYYKIHIPQKLYDAMYNYEVEIDD